MTNQRTLVDDKDIAEALCVSPSWVRKQRHFRRNNLPHVLNIDPVMIASMPRYRQSDVSDWITSLGELQPEVTGEQHVN